MTIQTPLFAAILTFLYILLSLNVVRRRFAGRVSLGDGEDRDLLKAIRIHSNFIEYIPLALLLMWFVENATLSPILIFASGTALVVARIMHVIGMMYPRNWMILRQLGTLTTMAVLIALSARLFAFYFPI